MGQVHDVRGGAIGIGFFIVPLELFVSCRYEDVVLHNGFFVSGTFH
jgi:hypothetical protein